MQKIYGQLGTEKSYKRHFNPTNGIQFIGTVSSSRTIVKMKFALVSKSINVSKKNKCVVRIFPFYRQ